MERIVEGGCHCGAVRWSATIPPQSTLVDCNCSICMKGGFVHLIIGKENFRLISGEDFLIEYTFNTHVARHVFCKRCGIKSYYHPRSHPDGISLNARCIDGYDMSSLPTVQFDGRHWEDSIDRLQV
eukprot:gnl/Spiro4/18750_TR10026_c0_g1_i1.p2 gnl/Spiro4/18750_TR10026_c0_g1~~gnl/Spiro4/18750_TR10026_c0_g1_i1.p2  ORF type:complete len:135 (+),score=18.77 gnl/Spiro4/18750_TR10026_c0_g1_i1:29-406(+)